MTNTRNSFITNYLREGKRDRQSNYHEGKDHVEEVKWLLKSAEQGNAKAQFALSMCYYYGYGVEKNYTDLDSFVTLFCVKGQGTVIANGISVEIKAGELVLIPASVDTVRIFPTNSMRILETYII